MQNRRRFVSSHPFSLHFVQTSCPCAPFSCFLSSESQTSQSREGQSWFSCQKQSSPALLNLVSFLNRQQLNRGIPSSVASGAPCFLFFDQLFTCSISRFFSWD